MKLRNPQRKYLIVILIAIGAILLTNYSVSYIVKKKIVTVLSENLLKEYTASVDKVEFKLIRRSLSFNGVKFVPKSEVVSDMVENKGEVNSVDNITLKSLELKGIGIFNLLFSKKISINTLSFNDLFIRKIENPNLVIEKDKKNKPKPINLDSIKVTKLGGLVIDNLEFVDLMYQVYDVSKSEITFQNSPVSFNSSGVKLVEIEENLFKLLPSQEIFKIEDVQLEFEKKNYSLSLDKLVLDFKSQVATINDFSFKPNISKFDLAEKYTFNDDVFDVTFQEVNVYNFNLIKLFKENAFLLDSVAINGLDLKLFKDKRKPFNMDKYVGLPHINLQNSSKVINVPLVSVKNSHLTIEEQLENKDTLFSLTINDINAKIQNISTIPEFTQNPITVNIDANLMNEAPLHVVMNMPLKKGQHTFYFSGELGQSEFELYDAALYPVLGLKILSGEIDKMQFSAKANNTSSSGNMTMLYHNLEATVFKSNSLERNKFLSWSVNHVVRKSNPNKKGKVKEVEMQFTRDTYKGLGNYIWKTLQSGIVNTISPTGKDKKK
ncbi:hypothetical protein [Urechidicola vernalis]|uniref:DUF748 domain-containing protein n=1 Tax=Urechidicola vernalis TaxID=3075600 RepID=A0ABU2Y689_9FLAO|nr:hypothetical protein [Urechidicola sp. P050]MDT0553719.1 hypothetical protein [Urechidicola sp. P050]